MASQEGKMKALLKNIQGSRRLGLICAVVMMFALILCRLVYFASVEQKLWSLWGMALVAGVITACVVESKRFTFVTISTSIVVVIFAFAFALTFTLDVDATAFGVVMMMLIALEGFVAIASLVVCDDRLSRRGRYSIGVRKILPIFLAEGGALCTSMTLVMPYLAISVLIALATVVSFLLIESRLALWLRDNPPSPLSVVRVAPVGIESFRQETQVVFRSRRPNTWLSGWHRKLYSIYNSNSR